MKNFKNYRRREKEQLLGEEILYEEKTLLRHNSISALKIFIIIIALALALLMLFVAAKVLFRIQSIEVEGNSRYSAEQIVENSGINYGALMFSFPSSRAERRLIEDLPYVEKVEIRREYPSTVHITVTEYDAVYAVSQMDKYILFSQDLKVLETADSNVWGDDVVFIEIPRIARAIEGRQIEFADLASTEYITDFIRALDELDIEQSIDKIELTDVFSIKMVCEGRYKISFGKYSDYSSMCLQMRSLSMVMSSDVLRNAPAASIDVTDPKQTSVIPYDRAEDLK